MFKIVPSTQSKQFRDHVHRRISESTHTLEIRRLSTPGMSPEDLQLIWMADVGLWSYFSHRPFKGRWVCWFGTRLPERGIVTPPSIEINIPVDTSRKALAGRAVLDGDGAYHLGHKGMLGGGRGGQMDMITFAANLRGFSHEAVAFPNGSEEKFFDIGRVDEANFLENLRRFVLECERLRALAKTGSPSTTLPAGNTIFDPENDRDGFGYRSSAQLFKIKREHGRVVNALREILGDRGKNGRKSFMRPDLYIEGRDGLVEMLFEVKVLSDTQNWFTALGQLVVYGAHQISPPRRILVCPTIRKDTNFLRALEILDVTVVTYRKSRGNFIFTGLSDLLR